MFAELNMAAEPGFVVINEDDEPVHSRTEGRVGAWRRIVKSLFRIRSWQRIWGVLGGVLRDLPANLRDRVRDQL